MWLPFSKGGAIVEIAPDCSQALTLSSLFLRQVFIEQTSGGNSEYQLFSDETWRRDTLVFVYPFPVCYPWYGDDCPPPPDLSTCKIVVDSLQAPLTQEQSPCTLAKLLQFTEIVTSFMIKMDEAKSGSQFYNMITALSVIKMVDGFESCKLLLESMLTTSETLTWMPGQRRCTEEWYTEAWDLDPCCNPGLILLPPSFPPSFTAASYCNL
jgi:hypothetical protein